MPDYTRSTGSSGTMMIRDTGTAVEFWLKAGSATFNHQLPWGLNVNGVNDNREFDFVSGGHWQRLGAWTVRTDQTVSFRLGDSGTSGLGGPTTLNAAIKRSTVPDPPGRVYLSGPTGTSMTATFTDGDNGGAAIDARQIWYSRFSTYHEDEIASDRSTLITGLTRGTRYYFWARTHNKNGWSALGAMGQGTTLNVPNTPTPVTISEIKQSSVKTFFQSGGSNGGSPVLEWQLAYGTHPTLAQKWISNTGTSVVTGLTPGTTYYFWARARNAVGWSSYSAVRSATTQAGAWINVNGVYKRAVPYINVGGDTSKVPPIPGVWKPASPWARIFGVWKESG